MHYSARPLLSSVFSPKVYCFQVPRMPKRGVTVNTIFIHKYDIQCILYTIYM